MGGEVEDYILKKLDAAIKESADPDNFKWFPKLYLPKLNKEFTELRELILQKMAKIKQAAAAAKKDSTTTPAPPVPAVRDPPEDSVTGADATHHDSTIPAAKEVIVPAGASKKSEAPPDEKDLGTPADKKETGASLDDDDAGDKKETDDAGAGAGDKKQTDAPSDDDNAGDKKQTDALSDEDDAAKKESGDAKEAGAPLAEKELDASAKTTSPKATTPSVASGSGKKESNVAQSISKDESEISPVRGDDDDDKSLTPPAADGAKETATFAKTTSPTEPEISPVKDDGATDHKSKTPPTSAKKELSGVPPTSAKKDLPVNEEYLLREQLYYLNNVLTEWQMITKRPFSLSSDYVSSIKDLSKTIKKIKLDLKPESNKKAGESSHSGLPPTSSSDNAGLITATPQEVEFRWSTRLVDLKKVYGFEDKILSLERLLVLRRKDTDTFKAFGIHGMAGVGKTTLCQSIFSRPKVTEYFFPRIWVCLSKQKDEDEDNKKEVVKRMLRCLGIDDKIINKIDEKKSIRGLLSALRLQLTGKRYFIVLDDAHNPDEWFKMPDSDADDNSKVYEKFSYGLPKECGGTVIVTSRVEKIVKNMVGEEENLRCIEPLTDQETCWKIFKDTVVEDETLFPPDLEKLKLEIVKRCDGLPLAAKLLGQIKHKELSAANNHPAAVEPGNQQEAVQAAK